MSCRERVANLLLQENNLMQIVKLIGSDVLPDDQKLTIEIARPTTTSRSWTPCRKISMPNWPLWPRADEEGIT